MIRIFYLSLLFSLISCGSETEDEMEVLCTPPVITENIIGTWEVATPKSSQSTMVTFNSDGTGANDTEEGPFIYYCRLNDEDIKDFKWRLDTFGSTEYIFVKYINTNCVQDNGLYIESNGCKRIEFISTADTIIMTKG